MKLYIERIWSRYEAGQKYEVGHEMHGWAVYVTLVAEYEQAVDITLGNGCEAGQTL